MAQTTLTLETVSGIQAHACLPALAHLRLEVFRDFPYLYEGKEADELAHLRIYASHPKAAIILAKDGTQIIGAATCLPLAASDLTVQKPFLDAGLRTDDIFYFGESVLLPAYRGRGLGVGFFKKREDWAKGARMACFCAVERPVDHPLRPENYVPLDEFWRHRGYQQRSELSSLMSWRDRGDPSPTRKNMIFWTKDL